MWLGKERDVGSSFYVYGICWHNQEKVTQQETSITNWVGTTPNEYLNSKERSSPWVQLGIGGVKGFILGMPNLNVLRLLMFVGCWMWNSISICPWTKSGQLPFFVGSHFKRNPIKFIEHQVASNLLGNNSNSYSSWHLTLESNSTKIKEEDSPFLQIL